MGLMQLHLPPLQRSLNGPLSRLVLLRKIVPASSIENKDIIVCPVSAILSAGTDLNTNTTDF